MTELVWQPLLALSPDRKTYVDVVDALVDDLFRLHPPSDLVPPTDPALDIKSETVLLFAELALLANACSSWGCRRYSHTEYLDAAAALLPDCQLTPALHNGFTQIAWIASHLRYGDDDTLADIDDVLVRWLSQEEVAMSFDLFQGVVGIGTYLLDRRHASTAEGGASLAVEALSRRAVNSDRHAVWMFEPDLLHADDRRLAPSGAFGFGMAHGNAGAITFLAHCVSAGVAVEQAVTLLRHNIEWFLEHTKGFESQGLPMFLSDGVRRRPELQGWCWGGLGAAWGLYQAGCLLNDTRACEVGVNMAAAAATEAVDRSFDACLCHGAVGNAHLFAKFYSATDMGVFADAARSWYDRTLRYRSDGLYGGFVFRVTRNGQPAFGDSARLMFGAVGVAPGLIAALTDAEPRWDRLLLLSPSA